MANVFKNEVKEIEEFLINRFNVSLDESQRKELRLIVAKLMVDASHDLRLSEEAHTELNKGL